MDDHYREVYADEKAKLGLAEEEQPVASRSAWGENSAEPHSAWGAGASDKAWAGQSGHWEDDNSYYASDQVVRLEQKLHAATEEASAKSKALQGLRLEKDELGEELARAVRDLDLLRDHCEMREAALLSRRRDWHEVVDDLKRLLGEDEKHEGESKAEGGKRPYTAILLKEEVRALFGGLESEATLSELATLRARLEAADAARTDEAAARISAEEALTAAHDKYASAGATSERTEALLRVQLADAAVALKAAEARAAELDHRAKDATTAAASETNRLQGEVTKLRASQSEAESSKVTEALAELDTLRKAEATGADTIARLRQELTTKDAAHQEALEKIGELQNRLNAQSSSSADDAAAATQASADEARKNKERIASLKAEKKKLESMTKELHSELKFALETGETLHKELDAMRSDLERAKSVSSGASKRIDEAVAEATAAEGKVSGLQAEVSAAGVATAKAIQSQQEWEAKFSDERRLRQKLSRKITDLQGNIRVICRVRPLSEREDSSCVVVVDSERCVVDGTSHTFDAVFGPESAQEQVFSEVQPTVMSALDGFNVCIFAYGQTGSGKTFTMEGPPSSRGVNYRALSELFTYAATSADMTYTFTVSMLEVYNEAISDLLNGGNGKASSAEADLDIRVGKGSRGGASVYVEGLVECDVSSLEEVEHLMKQGARNRHVGATNMNEHSSRSHLVLSVNVTGTARKGNVKIYGKLNLIDLAGSERLAKTGAEGVRLKEAQNINKSLSALGDVVAALGRNQAHIPYRNSKLTFLLQDSLSSNSRVLMFVNVTSCLLSAGESQCSLNFAGRCRAVQLGAAKKTVRESSVGPTERKK